MIISTPTPCLVTVSDACALLSVSRTTLHRLIKSGQLPKVCIGKRGIRIPAHAITALAGQSQTGDLNQ